MLSFFIELELIELATVFVLNALKVGLGYVIQSFLILELESQINKPLHSELILNIWPSIAKATILTAGQSGRVQ